MALMVICFAVEPPTQLLLAKTEVIAQNLSFLTVEPTHQASAFAGGKQQLPHGPC